MTAPGAQTRLILAYFDQHPNATSAEIAEAAGCAPDRARKVLREHGRTLASTRNKHLRIAADDSPLTPDPNPLRLRDPSFEAAWHARLAACGRFEDMPLRSANSRTTATPEAAGPVPGIEGSAYP